MDIEETAAAYRKATGDDWRIERALLLAEIDQLRDLVRQLERERDQWQRQAISNG